jgi:hypothetical protein
MKKWGAWAASLALATLSGCSVTHGTPFNPSLVGKQKYLCCNMSFDIHDAASDANYGQYALRAGEYGKGPMLAAGTKVTLIAVGSSGVAFSPDGTDQQYTLRFAYGRKQMTPDQYFARIFLDTDPRSSPEPGSGPSTTQLTDGMTKEQALLARGYPPAHHTPNLDQNEWVYFETPGFVDRVVFVDGKIQSITRGPAPE